MKNSIQNLSRIYLVLLFMGLAYFSFSQPPPPPPEGGGAARSGGNKLGAPIDGGLGILLAMGAAYGGKKLYQAYKKKKETTEDETDVLT